MHDKYRSQTQLSSYKRQRKSSVHPVPVSQPRVSPVRSPSSREGSGGSTDVMNTFKNLLAILGVLS